MKRDHLRVLKAALERKRTDLADVLEKRDRIAVEQAPDTLDQVQLTAERELAIETMHRETLVLKQVRDALRRMDEGVYGVCARCEGDIGFKRLQALPWAIYCVICQASVDEETRPGSPGSQFFVPENRLIP